MLEVASYQCGWYRGSVWSPSRNADCMHSGIFLFPRATSQVAMLAWIFSDCQEGVEGRETQEIKGYGFLLNGSAPQWNLQTSHRKRRPKLWNF